MTVRDWSRFPKVFLKIHISINIGLRLFEVSLYTEAHGRVHSDLHINLFKKKFIWRMCFAITCATVSNESAGTSDPMTHRKWRPHAPQMTLQGFCVYQRSSIPHGKAPTRSQDDAARLLCISEFINITWGSAHAHPRRRYKASVYISVHQHHSVRVYSSKNWDSLKVVEKHFNMRKREKKGKAKERKNEPLTN